MPFTAQTRMSGVDLPDGRRVRKGAADAVRRWVGAAAAAPCRAELDAIVDGDRRGGGTPLVVADETASACSGVVHLKDIVKQGMRERFDELRAWASGR